MKFLKLVSAVAIYLIGLLAIYYIHSQYFRVNVVFYGVLFDVVLAALIFVPVLVLTRPFAVFTSLEKFQCFVIAIMAGYIFAISVPTVLDRSLSFYILEKLQQRGGGIRQDRFAEIFTQEYVREHRLVDVRLTEQQESGTIKIENGCVKLTERGERLAQFSGFFRKHLLPKQRLLMGSYTDDLTDPFRRSDKTVTYECR